MRPKLLLLFYFFVCTLFAAGQKQWSNWYFNGYSMLTFNTPGNKGQLVTNYLPPAPTNFTNYVNWPQAATSYSDPATGTMQFMISSRLAFDRMFEMINAPADIQMCPGDPYAIHIVPFKSDPNKFYIIQFQDGSADMLAASSGLQVRCPNAIGLGYSVFDLRLNGGRGGFESMNNVLLSGVPERIAVIRHANGGDAWVVVHGWGSNAFYAYLFSDAGVSQPVVSHIGPTISGAWNDALGHMAASHNGRQLAAQKSGNNFVELYNFDNGTGAVSNFRTLNNSGGVDRLLFSPDDTKLYCLGDYQSPGVYQYNLTAPDIAGSLFKVAEDKSKTFWQMQLGLDGRIYIGAVQDPDTDYFSIINCPNLPEYASNFQRKGMAVRSYAAFPSLINDFIKQPSGAPVTKFSLGKDTAICFGSYTLSAPTGWDSYRWNTGETTRQITVTTPGTYYVLTGELGFSCPSAYGGITITNAAKPLNLGKDTTLCPGLPYTINVPSNFTSILWNDGTTDKAKLASRPGTYSVAASDENGCRNWDTILVGAYYYPKVQFGRDTTLCQGQSLLLQLEPPSSFSNPQAIYLWQDGSTEDSFHVTQPGTYWGKVSYQGCTISDTIAVGYVSAQNVSLGADTSLCNGDSLQLRVNVPGSSIQWSTGSTASSILVRTSGTYWVNVNNGSCTVSDTIEVRFVAPPVVELGRDTSLCDGARLTLIPNGSGGTYLWQDGSTQDKLTVSTAGTYWTTVTRNGCSASDSIQVAYKRLPSLQLGRDTSICTGALLLLNAANPEIASYQWQNGAASPTYLVQTAGVYQVQVRGVNGCVNSDTIRVNVTPLPSFALPADTALCERQSLLLDAGLTGATYLWNTGSSSRTLTVTAAGLYWVEATQNGCAKRDSIAVSYKPLPVVFLGADTTLCEGKTLLLNAANPGATYLWQNGGTTATQLVRQPGVYQVTVNLNGCKVAGALTVRYTNKPSFSLGRDTVLCPGTSFVMMPSLTGASFLWQDGTSAALYTVKDTGVYRLTATNQCGSFTDERKVSPTICHLQMPTAFSPNRDGKNDVFRVPNPSFIKTFTMMVYNRWGEVVFCTNDPYKGWDGKWRSVDQPVDHYVWYISLVDREGRTEVGKGNVLIVR